MRASICSPAMKSLHRSAGTCAVVVTASGAPVAASRTSAPVNALPWLSAITAMNGSATASAGPAFRTGGAALSGIQAARQAVLGARIGVVRHRRRARVHGLQRERERRGRRRFGFGLRVGLEERAHHAVDGVVVDVAPVRRVRVEAETGAGDDLV